MGKTERGVCHICGEQGILTFEHIPPKAAFNNQRVKLYNLLDTHKSELPWDFSGIRYTESQKGNGRYSLCERCNNITGSWYGEAYAEFAVNTVAALASCQIKPNSIIGLYARQIYPLRIMKQILSMFCSINHAGFIIAEDFKKLILDKETKGINKSNIRISMYISTGSIMRQFPLSAMGNIERNSILMISELTTHPFGFILDTSPKAASVNALDITDFAFFDYNECVDMTLNLPILETNTAFPTDYRSKEEIIEQARKNAKYKWSSV